MRIKTSIFSQYLITNLISYIPHRELGWLRALSHKAVDSGFKPPWGDTGEYSYPAGSPGPLGDYEDA